MSRKNKQKENKPNCVCSPDHMSREEMTQMIADAIILAEKQKTEMEQPVHNETIDNKIVWLLTFMLFPDKVIKGDGAVLDFQKIILQALFLLLEMCGFVSCFVIIKGVFSSNQEWFVVVLELLFGFAAFVIAAALHVVRAEIENIRDKNYLLSISALVASLVSIAIALYSHSKGGC